MFPSSSLSGPSQGEPASATRLRTRFEDTLCHRRATSSAPDRIAIVDIEPREVVGELPAGDAPDGIGYSPLKVRTRGASGSP